LQVRDVIITGTSLAKSAAALALATRLGAGTWATAGVHPHDASTWDAATADALAELAAHPRCVAIGCVCAQHSCMLARMHAEHWTWCCRECGLDFNRNFSTPEAQEAALSAQLALAARLHKPLFMHCRDAAPRLAELLAPALPSLSAPAVVHCFTGSAEEARMFVSMGLYIGFTGWACDEREGRAAALADAIREVPIDRLLLETDAPYLVPRSIAPARARPRRNEPCLLPHVAAAVAAAHGVSVEELAAATTRNAERVFGLGR
jgi:TatD DNase family protein